MNDDYYDKLKSQIPSINEIMRFYLKILYEKRITTDEYIFNELKELFKITDEHLKIKTKTQEPVFKNRIRWAKKYFIESQIIQSKKRSRIVQITDRGIQVYTETRGNIDSKYLEKYPEYIEFLNRKINKYTKKTEILDPNNSNDKEIKTEEDLKASNFDLSEQIKNISFDKFKKLIIELLYKLEYGTRKRIKKNIYSQEDCIIKGIIYKDTLNIGVSLYLYAIHAPNGILEAKKFQDFINQVNSNLNKKFIFITNADLSTKQFYVDNLKERNIVTTLDSKKIEELSINYGIVKTKVVYLFDDSF